MNTVYCKSYAQIRDTADEFGPNGGFVAVLSTPSVDRDGDTLKREEWKDFAPGFRYPLDIDHEMSVADTVGSFEPYWDGDTMMMRATFASTAKAQEVRTLVREGHVSGVSVAFLTDKSVEDGPSRELLNAGIVAIPSNRDALILASKAASALKDALGGEVPADIKEAVMSALGTKEPKDGDDDAETEDVDDVETDDFDDAETDDFDDADTESVDDEESEEKDTATAWALAEVFPSGKSVVKAVGGDGSLVQAIHDASCHLGASCAVVESTDSLDGASEGANKGVEGPTGTVLDGAILDVTINVKDIYSGAGIDPAVEECPPGQADEHTKHKVRAIDAVLDEAVALSCGSDRSILPEPVAQALDLITSAKITAGVLMEHLGIYDPDALKGVDPQEAFTKALDDVLVPEVKSPDAAAADVESPAPASADVSGAAKRARGADIMAMIARSKK